LVDKFHRLSPMNEIVTSLTTTPSCFTIFGLGNLVGRAPIE
jgi:hypothetical protein